MVRELRATAYRPRVAVLGARAQLCINDRVAALGGSAVNHACNALNQTRPSACRFRNAIPDSLSSASLTSGGQPGGQPGGQGGGQGGGQPGGQGGGQGGGKGGRSQGGAFGGGAFGTGGRRTPPPVDASSFGILDIEELAAKGREQANEPVE